MVRRSTTGVSGLVSGRFALLVGAMLAVAVLFAACGPDPTATPRPTATPTTAPEPTAMVDDSMTDAMPSPTEPDTGGGPAPTPTPAPPPTATPDPVVRGGVVSFSREIPSHLDTTDGRCGRSVNQGFHSMVHDSLIGHPSGPGSVTSSSEIVGYLAEEWETINPRTYRFTLRENARFADLPPVNGRRVTSEDVKFSLLRYAAAPECAPETQSIASIDTPDDRTVIVNLSEDFAPWLDAHAESQAWILPQEAGTPDPEAPGGVYFREVENVIGAGPFVLDAFDETGEAMRLVKNDNYWNADLIYIDAIETDNIPDYSTEFGKLMNGELSWLGSVDIATLPLARNNPNLNIYETTRSGSTTWYIAVSKPPFDDVNVRRAMALAYGQDEFIEVNGGGVRRCGLIGLTGPSSSICDEISAESRRWWLDEADDVELAKQLLANAGYPNGFQTTINMSSSESLYRRYKPDLFAAQMARVGIEVTDIERIDRATHRRVYMASGDWTGVGVTTGDPNTVWRRINTLTLGDYLNFNDHINDPYIIERVDEYKRTIDKARRDQLVREIGEQAASQVYALHLPTEPQFSAWPTSVQNLSPMTSRDDSGRQWVGVWLQP